MLKRQGQNTNFYYWDSQVNEYSYPGMVMANSRHSINLFQEIYFKKPPNPTTQPCAFYVIFLMLSSSEDRPSQKSKCMIFCCIFHLISFSDHSKLDTVLRYCLQTLWTWKGPYDGDIVKRIYQTMKSTEPTSYWLPISIPWCNFY